MNFCIFFVGFQNPLQRYYFLKKYAIEKEEIYAKSLKQVIFLRKVDCFGFLCQLIHILRHFLHLLSSTFARPSAIGFSEPQVNTESECPFGTPYLLGGKGGG